MIANFQLEDRAVSRAGEFNELAKKEITEIRGTVGVDARISDISETGIVSLITTQDSGTKSVVDIPFELLEMNDDEFQKFYNNSIKNEEI